MADDPTNEVEGVVVEAPAARAKRQRGIQVYMPQIQVRLFKVVNRNTTAGAATVSEGVEIDPRVADTSGNSIDLTPLLGEGTTVTIQRTVRGADSGTFSINFPDQLDGPQSDSLYGLMEAMDAIEIRLTREAGPGDLPVVMRGFISTVSRPENITENGVSRVVVIEGHDYSKILNVIRFIYLPTMIPSQMLLTSFSLFMNYGIEATHYDRPSEFVERVLNEVVKEFLDKMRAGSGGGLSPVLDLKVDATDSDKPGSVQPFGVQEWNGGSVMDLLMQFGDVPIWNELYVEDRDDGPYLVYRPTPFKTAADDYIQGGASAKSIWIDAADLITLSPSRGDADVANYYWVEAPILTMLDAPLVQMDQTLSPQPALDNYQNCSPTLYGIRLMRVSSNQGQRFDGQAEETVKAGEGTVLEQIAEKRRVLIESNKDNSVFERGTMTLKGNEKIKAGMYVQLDRGGFKASYYVIQVTHQVTIGGAFLTSVIFERGTGFIERLQRQAAASPYISEQTIGQTYG